MKNSQILKDQLDSTFADIFNPNEPGGSVFIQQGDTILYSKSFGLSDILLNTPFTSASVCNLGSISKTFVAYGILMLQNRKLLSIDDSIIKYFPDFQNKEIASKVTIKNLLTHTSGLPDSRETVKDSIFYLTAKDEGNFTPIKLTQQLEFEPGSQWKYSNPAYNGLALIIEKASKMKWQNFISKYIFEPAGMDNSTITDGAHPSKYVAHGYRKWNGQWVEYDYGEYPTFAAAGNGGVWSSIDELRKYADAIKNCLFTDCQTIAAAQTPREPDNWSMSRDPWHGLAWFRHKSYLYDVSQDEQFTVIEHAGDQGGFRAHLLMIPGPDITIIWITNNEKVITPYIWEALKSTGFIR